MSVSPYRAAMVVILLIVAACNPPPWTVSGSSDAITLRWYVDDTDIAAAQSIADRHCGSTGRSAVLASNEQSGSIQVAEYQCR